MLHDEDSAKIREVVIKVFKNWSSMNPDRNDNCYLADDQTVLFDCAPMKDVGWRSQKDRLRRVFEDFERFDMVPNEDLAIHHLGDLGWATTTWSFVIRLKDGKRIEKEGRATFVFQRRSEQWLVVHDHVSIPMAL